MNRIIDFVLMNRLLIVVVALVVFAGGYFSYKVLPIDAFPDVQHLVRMVQKAIHARARRWYLGRSAGDGEVQGLH